MTKQRSQIACFRHSLAQSGFGTRTINPVRDEKDVKTIRFFSVSIYHEQTWKKQINTDVVDAIRMRDSKSRLRTSVAEGIICNVPQMCWNFLCIIQLAQNIHRMLTTEDSITFSILYKLYRTQNLINCTVIHILIWATKSTALLRMHSRSLSHPRVEIIRIR